MPQIIVVATGTDPSEGAVMLRERITARDLESDHFGKQLLERLTWAVGDAHETEQADPSESEVWHGEPVRESTRASVAGRNPGAMADAKLPTRTPVVG